MCATEFHLACAGHHLGLIHANHGGEIIDYLLSQLRDAASDVVRHGGCLGLGLAAMGTARQDVYDQLKNCLELDDAVTGITLNMITPPPVALQVLHSI